LPFTQGAARALLYLIVAYQPDYFGMPISQLTFVEDSVAQLFDSLSQLKRNIADNLVLNVFQVRNLFECLDYQSRSSATSENLKPYVPRPGGMKIEVKNLSFSYRKHGKDVLEDVSFTIEPGQIVSIVGYNGSGILFIHEIS
jgi:ABC-type multidrug transport system fused ATPase/permease subunit